MCMIERARGWDSGKPLEPILKAEFNLTYIYLILKYVCTYIDLVESVFDQGLLRPMKVVSAYSKGGTPLNT